MTAFAFNNSIEILAKNNQTLADFTYNNHEMRKVFVDQLSKLNFRGVSVSNIEIVHIILHSAYILLNS